MCIKSRETTCRHSCITPSTRRLSSSEDGWFLCTAEIGTKDGRTVPAAVVGYDHETGFGLLRGLVPLKVAPIAFGRSADVKEADPVLVASAGGAAMAASARVVAKREFAGSWEYLV